MTTYSLWTRRKGVRPDGTRYDKEGWVKVSGDPLTHREALIVRSKHMEPSGILIYPSDDDPNGKRFMTPALGPVTSAGHASSPTGSRTATTIGRSPRKTRTPITTGTHKMSNKRMKLWILRPMKGLSNDSSPWIPWYDKCYGFIVSAATEIDARRAAGKQAGDEKSTAWQNPELSTCKELGAGVRTAVIMRDFSAA